LAYASEVELPEMGSARSMRKHESPDFSRGESQCWQETRPDIDATVEVSIVDMFAVPAVEDALREAFRVA